MKRRSRREGKGKQGDEREGWRNGGLLPSGID